MILEGEFASGILGIHQISPSGSGTDSSTGGGAHIEAKMGDRGEDQREEDLLNALLEKQ